MDRIAAVYYRNKDEIQQACVGRYKDYSQSHRSQSFIQIIRLNEEEEESEIEPWIIVRPLFRFSSIDAARTGFPHRNEYCNIKVLCTHTNTRGGEFHGTFQKERDTNL